jgi:hypothetical protein
MAIVIVFGTAIHAPERLVKAPRVPSICRVNCNEDSELMTLSMTTRILSTVGVSPPTRQVFASPIAFSALSGRSALCAAPAMSASSTPRLIFFATPAVHQS